ncbi:MAG: heme-copper oxidase subunit III [Planctomycetota bacterium]|nr:MAG: heme-copper oxidase subunit III [Planctomycetota bacterium]
MPTRFKPPIAGKLETDRRWEQGAWIFLVSLTVFFLACMILYAIYVALRLNRPGEPVQPFWLPPLFVLTTVILVAISTLLHLAVLAVRCERHADLARYMVLSFLLALSFFVIQGTALSQMIERMEQPGPAMRNLYGMTFFLVIVHALHVLGGVAGMVFVLFGIRRKAYDHERNFPVRFCAMYWHFLDVVWIIMLISFSFAAAISK